MLDMFGGFRDCSGFSFALSKLTEFSVVKVYIFLNEKAITAYFCFSEKLKRHSLTLASRQTFFSGSHTLNKLHNLQLTIMNNFGDELGINELGKCLAIIECLNLRVSPKNGLTFSNSVFFLLYDYHG